MPSEIYTDLHYKYCIITVISLSKTKVLSAVRKINYIRVACVALCRLWISVKSLLTKIKSQNSSKKIVSNVPSQGSLLI